MYFIRIVEDSKNSYSVFFSTCVKTEELAWQSRREYDFMESEGCMCVQQEVGGGLHVQVYCIDVKHSFLFVQADSQL